MKSFTSGVILLWAALCTQSILCTPLSVVHAQTVPSPQPSQVSQALELSKATGRPIFVMAGRET